MVAASNSVRDVDVAARPAGVVTVSNRGLAGIDGTLSTAWGVALATAGPVRLLVGDLAFLHDVNALLPVPGEARPDLTVVLVNDDGGGIFTGLEHGEPARAATFERLFATPHGSDVGALCAGYGVRYGAVTTLDGLRAALGSPPSGRSVVHVRVDRSRLRELHAQLGRAAAAAQRS